MTPHNHSSRNTKRRWWNWIVAILALGLVIFYFAGGNDLKSIHLKIASYHWLIVFLLVAIAPIFGFSIVICYMVIGSKFGIGGGLVVIALATTVHLLTSHWIATSFLRKRIEAFITKKNYHLPHVPDGENASISVMTAIIPGLPYFIRNYLLALARIPLKTYFWVCLPVYVFRSLLTLLAANFSAELTIGKGAFLVGVFLIKVAICAYIIKRLRDKSSRSSQVPLHGDMPM